MRFTIVLLALSTATVVSPNGAAAADQGARATGVQVAEVPPTGVPAATPPQPGQDVSPADPTPMPPDLAPGAKSPVPSQDKAPAAGNLPSPKRSGKHGFCKRDPGGDGDQPSKKPCRVSPVQPRQ